MREDFLLKSQTTTSKSLHDVMTLLSQSDHNPQTIFHQIHMLSQEELVQLYEWMRAEQMPLSSFQCFKELLKTKEKHPQVIYLVQNSPVISQELLSAFFKELNEEYILALIEHLLNKVQNLSEYTPLLHQVLLCFCQRLYDKPVPETLLHQWSERVFAKELAHHLWTNPECLYSLSQINGLYAWAAWVKPQQTLKYRIDALLNYKDLEAHVLKQYALVLLDYFSPQPEKLYSLFSALNSSEENRSPIGKKNLLRLKQSCWELLDIKKSYEETEFLNLFYYFKLELFQPVFTYLIQEKANYSLYQQALWLAKATEEIKVEFSSETLISILTYSLQDNVLINWEKTTDWLEKQSMTNQLIFIKKLIGSDFNLNFNQQAHQLINHCSQLMHHLHEFNEQELAWLLKFVQKEQVSSWLELLQQRHEEHSLNLGLLFSLLCPNKSVLEGLLATELFNNPLVLAEIYAELHVQTDCSIHLLSIHQMLSNKEKMWVNQFLLAVYPKIHSVSHHLITLFIINNLILNNISLFSADQPQDLQVLREHLKLLLLLTKKTQNKSHLDELKQLIVLILHSFINKEGTWARALIHEPITSKIIMAYLEEETDCSVPPLTYLFTLPEITNLEPEIKQHALIQGFIKQLLIQSPENLNAEQFILLFNWLLPDNRTHLAQTIFALAEDKIAPQNISYPFVLLKTALTAPADWNKLSATEEQQTQFIKSFETNKCSPQQMLELIQTVTNPRIKSLLILSLINQTGYLNSLKGYTLVEILTEKHPHHPSRLNTLIHQIDPRLLSKIRIMELTAEPALALLCSLPHFHRLTEKQVHQLLDRLPQPEAICYWLNHYATMPNAYYILAHLIKCDQTAVYTELNKLKDTKKEWLIKNIIAHLELFVVDDTLFREMEHEDYLSLAIELYLNGHNHAAYSNLIKQLTKRLLSKNRVFSSQTAQLLILLHNDAQFEALNSTTAYLINHHLKTQAQAGSTDLFYEQGTLAINKMKQLVRLKPKYPEEKKVNGLFSHLLIPILSTEERHVVLTNKNHPLIEIIAEREQFIRAFDYFLIYYKGDKKTLNKALHDYLRNSISQNRDLYHISTLITRGELESSTREAIYEALLAYPILYDEHISYCMFLFDTKKTLLHFGLKGTKSDYQHVINLCTWALKKLDPTQHQESIEIATTALFEAQTELAFAKNSGFFSRLFRPIVRCWVYGWSGFFVANPPLYVNPVTSHLPSSEKPKKIASGQEVPSIKKDFIRLLNELENEITVHQLNELLPMLKAWDYQKKPEQEIEIRDKLHSLFGTLLRTSQEDKNLHLWLQEHQTTFIMNRFRLLEQALTHDKPDELLTLLQKMNNDAPHFHYVTEELVSMMPEEINRQRSESPIPTGQNKAALLDTASFLVHSAWAWTTRFNFFDKTSVRSFTSEPELPVVSSQKI
jgi:hypothetical protein